MSWSALTKPRLLERRDKHKEQWPVGYSFRCEICDSRFAVDEPGSTARTSLGFLYAYCPHCTKFTYLHWWGSRRLKPEEKRRD